MDKERLNAIRQYLEENQDNLDLVILSNSKTCRWWVIIPTKDLVGRLELMKMEAVFGPFDTEQDEPGYMDELIEQGFKKAFEEGEPVKVH